jgi:steroid 5-alpha reductase family enzyme
MSPKALGLLAQGVAYTIALATGLAAGSLVPGLDPLWRAALGDVVATLVIFAFSVSVSNSSMYDPYWSVAPPALFGFWLAAGEASPRALLAGVLVFAWGARLTWNFARGWPGLHHEDWRYVDLRGKHGRAYWVVSFFGLHFFPTVLTFVASLPLRVVTRAEGPPLGPLDLLALVVTAGAITIEALSDEQLRAHARSGAPRESICERGLWRYSRHPNYFGELSFWWGLALFSLAADPSALWALGGAVAITLLFVFISVPLLDRRMLARRPAYAEHMKRVSALVPWRRREIS